MIQFSEHLSRKIQIVYYPYLTTNIPLQVFSLINSRRIPVETGQGRCGVIPTFLQEKETLLQYGRSHKPFAVDFVAIHLT